MEFNATFIVSAISFVIFSIIMNAVFYKPLQKIVEKREAFIDETTKEAKMNTKKSEDILFDKSKKVENTKFEAKKNISQKTDEVQKQKAAMASEAQQKAADEVQKAKEVLESSKTEAQSTLEQETQKLAQDISAKILGTV